MNTINSQIIDVASIGGRPPSGTGGATAEGAPAPAAFRRKLERPLFIMAAIPVQRKIG
jgi:hypothetical protein